jgi:hypothetical protein
MFYVLIFGIMAVVLVVGGLANMRRRRMRIEHEERQTEHTAAERRNRKAKRAQSKADRRHRH